MRIRRSARLGVVLAGVIGVMATFVPAASAHGRTDITFTGRAELNAGLSAPCNTVLTTTTTTLPDTTVTKGTKTCPPQLGQGNPLNKKDNPFHVNGNTRTGTFESDDPPAGCVATGTNGPDKTGKQTVQGPAGCSIGASFTVTGYCGLSQGRGTGIATVQPNWTIWFNFTWTDGGGGNLVITGNWWKGGPTKPATVEGDLVAYVKATPDPLAPPPNSCLDKTARIFLVHGTATLVHPKCTPPQTLPGCIEV